jgi:phosphatidylserine decarboxylase
MKRPVYYETPCILSKNIQQLTSKCWVIKPLISVFIEYYGCNLLYRSMFQI